MNLYFPAEYYKYVHIFIIIYIMHGMNFYMVRSGDQLLKKKRKKKRKSKYCYQ